MLKGSMKNIEGFATRNLFGFLVPGLFLWMYPMLSVVSPSINGFDLSTLAIPIEETRRGGPLKDGIPATFKPEFVTAHEATFL